MNNRAVIATGLLLVAAAVPVLAQAPAPTSPQPASQPGPPASSAAPEPSAAPAATATSGDAPMVSKDGLPPMRSVREQCRTEVLSSGVKGDARRQSMADCIIKQRPDMEPRIKCAMDPSLKGMDKDARRAAVKICVQKAKG